MGTTQEFSYYDYAVFGLTLSVSLGIGIFYAFRGNNTTSDYLQAGKSMSPIPVAFSLTATYLSSISILGYIGEVYGHGIQLTWSILGNFLGVVVVVHTAIPILCKLRINSINEYLELRFKSSFLRKLISIFNCVAMITYLGICLYAPTLALDAVTPLSLWIYIPVLGAIVTIYSSLGGLKAVVWTDTFQTIIIISGIVVATIFAIATVGGFGNMISIAELHGRTEALDFSLGLYERHTAVNTVVLGFVTFLTLYGINQSTLQRISTMPTMGKVRLILYLNIIGISFLIAILFLCGLAIFAVYAGCDPIALDLIQRKDQLLPYFVMDYLGHLKGIPGLFVACLFCGTLSSISSALNSIVSLIWEDFMVEMVFFQEMKEFNKAVTMKVMTAVCGLIMVGLAFLFTTVRGVLQATMKLQGTLNGSPLAVFILGMFVPFGNKKGALAGIVVSQVVMLTLSIGSMYAGPEIVMLPLYTDKCNDTEWELNLLNNNQSSVDNFGYNITTPESGPRHPFFGISYTYYATLGVITCLITGIFVSIVTGGENLEEMDSDLVIGCMRRFVGNKKEKEIVKNEQIFREEAITKL